MNPMKLKPLLCEVTQDDIERATPSPAGCPVARAVRRAISGRYPVSVYQDRINCGTFHLFLLPQEMNEFISSFDVGRTAELKPFRFRIERNFPHVGIVVEPEIGRP